MTSWWLHSVSYVLLSVGLLSTSWAAFTTYVALRKETRRPSHVSKDISESSPTLTVIERLGLIAFCLCLAGFAENIYFLNEAFFRPSVYEYHNVKILKVIDDYSWLLQKDDGVFRADFCRDYYLPGIGAEAGYTLSKFRFEDKGCWSINSRPDLGFWWKRDADGRAIKEN